MHDERGSFWNKVRKGGISFLLSSLANSVYIAFTSAAAAAATAPHTRDKQQHNQQSASFTLACILLSGFFISIPVNVMAPHLTAVARDFSLNDKDRDVILGGWMSLAFFIFGTPPGFYLGSLADRMDRKFLLQALLLSSSLIALCTGLSWALWQLLLLRMCLGTIVASLHPILMSIVGDLVAPLARPAINSYISLALGGGTAVGQLVSGAGFGGGSWRLPYIAISICSFLVLFVVSIVAVDPPRGQADREKTPSSSSETAAQQSGSSRLLPSSPDEIVGGGASAASGLTSLPSPVDHRQQHDASASASPAASQQMAFSSSPQGGGGGGGLSVTSPSSSSSSSSSSLHLSVAAALDASSLYSRVLKVLSVRTNRLIFAQSLFGTLPWSVVSVFLPDFLRQELGFEVSMATQLVLCFGVGAILGGLVGGSLVGTLIYRHRGPAVVALVIAAIQACSSAPLIFILNMQPLNAVADGGGRLEDAAGGGGESHLSAAAPPSKFIIFFVASLAGFLASQAGPNLKTMLMNANTPHSRGAVFTVATAADNISKGCAPLILSSITALGHFSRASVYSGAMLGWLISGCFIAAVSQVIREDELQAKRSSSSTGFEATSSRSAHASAPGSASSLKE